MYIIWLYHLCLQIQLFSFLALEVLTLLQSERPKLYAILAFLSVIGLIKMFTCFLSS